MLPHAHTTLALMCSRPLAVLQRQRAAWHACLVWHNPGVLCDIIIIIIIMPRRLWEEPECPCPLRGNTPHCAAHVQVAEGRAEGREGAEDPLKEFMDALGNRARSVGEKIKSTWDAMGNSVGQAIIRFGFAIHAMLCVSLSVMLMGIACIQIPAWMCCQRAQWLLPPVYVIASQGTLLPLLLFEEVEVDQRSVSKNRVAALPLMRP